jgi:hypothetical protein
MTCGTSPSAADLGFTGFSFPLLQPLGHMGAGDDPPLAAATTGHFRLWQRIFGPAVFPELREFDSWLSVFPQSPRWQRLWRCFLGVRFLGTQSFDDFGHEEQLLIGRGCIPLATLAEHRPLKEPQLLDSLCQLLSICGGHLLLLGDDRRLVCDDLLLLRDNCLLLGIGLLQLTHALLTGCQLIGKRWIVSRICG